MEEELKRLNALQEKAKLIELKPVISSNIAGIGYSEKDQLLKVAFKNKDKFATYLYEHVGPDVFSIIRKSESVGKAISENIIRQKDKYKYIKL